MRLENTVPIGVLEARFNMLGGSPDEDHFNFRMGAVRGGIQQLDRTRVSGLDLEPYIISGFVLSSTEIFEVNTPNFVWDIFLQLFISSNSRIRNATRSTLKGVKAAHVARNQHSNPTF
jgi:hypothetical protein